MILSIKTTSCCHRPCKHCSVIPWMDANPDYHTSIEDIKKLIRYSLVSHYKFKKIILSGGEPLLWKDLTKGIELLYNSRIANKIIVFTNGLCINKDTVDLVKHVLKNCDVFRVAYYKKNKENILFLKKNIFSKKIRIVDRSVHLIPPTTIIPNTLPAICQCKAYAMFDGKIDLCGPARSIMIMLGLNSDNYSQKLQPNFLDKFQNQKREEQVYCQYCISNKKVQKQI